MQGVIYKYTNKINGKVYIGQTVHENLRRNEHKCHSKTRLHTQSAFYNAIDKYGWDNFGYSILETVEAETIAAPDFTLTDQYGNTHTLSDYRGKIVFLNFWATWCPPCRAELPDIQALYEDYSRMEDPDVVVLGVAFPGLGDEQDVAGVTQFLEENGLTYPVLMDTEAKLILPYYITAYPTTFMIDPEGNVLGYIPGSMTRDIMDSVIEQSKELSGMS